jgi:hypothetical protein
MSEYGPLTEGSFYWVIPTFDVDAVDWNSGDTDAAADACVNHWKNRKQPARFSGYDEHGQELWHLLDTEGTDWSVIWIGKEIIDGDQATRDCG